MATNDIILPQRGPPEDLDASVGQEEELPDLSEYFISDDLAGEGTMAIYNKRINYANELLQEYPATEGIVDFNFAEKHLYGRVDRFFIPIVPVANRPEPQALELVNIKGSLNRTKPVKAFNFVADNFKELRSQFRKATAMGKISERHPFLSDPKAYRAYENPRILFKNHRRNYDQGIEDIFRDDRLQVSNFNEFVVRLMPYLEDMVRAHPFTFPAFVKSNYCPINASGLVIDIADIEPSKDFIKVTEFIQSVNWDYYVNACNTYGFMIDRLYPWRLVGDIASQPMLKKSVQYGVGSTDDILNIGYTAAHRRYFRDFAGSMLNLYRRVKRPVVTVKSCGPSMRAQTRQPVAYSPETFSSQYDTLFMLRLYCTIRFGEEESPYTDHEKQKLIEDCMEIARHDPQKAVDVFERILNKTFDYIGSLDYIKRKYDRIEAETKKDVFSNY